MLRIIIIFLLISFTNLISQENFQMPSIKLKTLTGEAFNTKDFNNDGKPFIINFWATWCKSCIQELTTLSELYPEWQKEFGIKIYAISLDDTRSSKRVAPLVKGKKWQFEVLIDENSDFKRAMNINNPPHTLLFNGKGELVWQHNGYAPGDENILLEQIRKILKNETEK